MDNTVPNVAVSESPKSNVVKYVVVEAVIVLTALAVIWIVIFQPFKYFIFAPAFLHNKDPLAMTKTVNAEGKIVDSKPLTTAPEIRTITIDEASAEPEVVEGLATGTVIQIVNISVFPQVVEFEGGLSSEARIAPNATWTSINLEKKGTFTFTIKKTGVSGSIILK